MYKIKNDLQDFLCLKFRLVHHRNRDKEQFLLVTRDSAFAEMTVVRLLIFLASISRLEVVSADMKGACPQSGLVKQVPYGRPPKQVLTCKFVWKLIRLPYDIGETRLQGIRVIENCMTKKYHMLVVHAVGQLFNRKKKMIEFLFFFAKEFNDSLAAGSSYRMSTFYRSLVPVLSSDKSTKVLKADFSDMSSLCH